jgi:hypothetical protein
MSAHLSRPRLFQRHLRCLFWVWVWVWDWFTLLLARSFTRSSSSCHPPFTQYPVPSRSLVRAGQTSPQSTHASARRTSRYMSFTVPLPPPHTAYNRSCSNKHNTGKRDSQSGGVEDQPQCPGLWHSSSPSARSLSRSPSPPPPSFTQSPSPPRSRVVMGRLVHTGLGLSSLVAHALHYPTPRTRSAL